MRASDRGSGEIDSASELSCACDPVNAPCKWTLFGFVFEVWASSMTSATSFGGITVLVGSLRLDCGFIAGDCRTVLVGFRPPALEVFLLVLRRGAMFDMDGLAPKSRLKSMGEVPTDVSLLRDAP